MKVIFTHVALLHLENAMLFLAVQGASATTRRRIRNRIVAEANWLAHNPRAGQFESWLEELGQGHRRWVVGNYKLIYLVGSETLVVTDVFDARGDTQRMVP